MVLEIVNCVWRYTMRFIMAGLGCVGMLALYLNWEIRTLGEDGLGVDSAGLSKIFDLFPKVFFAGVLISFILMVMVPAFRPWWKSTQNKEEGRG